MPDAPGQDKSTVLDDKRDIFDFEAEAAPILQALVGRSLEQARIEVIETYEV